MSRKLLHVVASLAVCMACAAAAHTNSGAGVPKANFLNAEEIETAHADITTAYDAVSRLRPNWLAGHGPTSFSGTQHASVFLDGQWYGPLDSLGKIPAFDVADIRYYDVTQAGARFGIRAGANGAISVRLKGSPPPAP
jgi:hypothetical protein